jgi:hypothetical protein
MEAVRRRFFGVKNNSKSRPSERGAGGLSLVQEAAGKKISTGGRDLWSLTVKGAPTSHSMKEIDQEVLVPSSP